MNFFASMPRDVLAIIISKLPNETYEMRVPCEGQRGNQGCTTLVKFFGKSRTNFLCTCRVIMETALEKVWKPHTHGGTGLVHAARYGFLAYYLKWSTAPKTVASKLVRQRAFEAALGNK